MRQTPEDDASREHLMAEGHAVHGMAGRVNQLAGQRVRSRSTPRFDADALDLHVLSAAEAHGKHLLVAFADVGLTVHLHFGMAGRLSVRKHTRALGPDGFPRTEPPEPSALWWRVVSPTHLMEVTAPTVCELLEPDAVESLHARLGPDPLRNDADPARFVHKVRASRRAIGALVLDQSVIAGVGNVYRAEILHRLRCSPFTPGNAMSEEAAMAIWDEARDLMQVGLGAGWIVADDRQLAMARELLVNEERVPRWPKVYAVYGRMGQACRVCGTLIAAERQGLQRVFWCPRCQPDHQP